MGRDVQPQPTHARPHSARTDQRHFASARPEGVHLLGQLGDAVLMELSVVAGQHAGAHLDDDGCGQGGDFLAQ